MRKRFLTLILLGLLVLGMPMAVAALGLDFEVKGGAGIGLGTTDNPNIPVSASDVRLSGGAGIDCDVYFLKAGPVDLGISIGADYSYLSFHSTWKNYLGLPLPTDQTSDATYNYINFPFMLVGSVPLNDSMRLVLKAGGFVGYFISGEAKLTYNPEQPLESLTNGSQTLDSSNTYRWESGLNFTAGLDIPIGSNFSVTPSLLFNMGLTNTTRPFAGTSYKDTFWALTAMIGIKYKAI